MLQNVEEKVLDFLKKNVNKENFTDLTAKKISDELFYASTSVVNALRHLENRGYIKRVHLNGAFAKTKRIYLLKEN